MNGLYVPTEVAPNAPIRAALLGAIGGAAFAAVAGAVIVGAAASYDGTSLTLDNGMTIALIILLVGFFAASIVGIPFALMFVALMTWLEKRSSTYASLPAWLLVSMILITPVGVFLGASMSVEVLAIPILIVVDIVGCVIAWRVRHGGLRSR